MTTPEPPETVSHLQTEVVGIAVILFTRDHDGAKKPVQRVVPLAVKEQRSLINFIKHKLHGGVLRASKLPAEHEAKRIIAP